jgi:hypothetical protein
MAVSTGAILLAWVLWEEERDLGAPAPAAEPATAADTESR